MICSDASKMVNFHADADEETPLPGIEAESEDRPEPKDPWFTWRSTPWHSDSWRWPAPSTEERFRPRGNLPEPPSLDGKIHSQPRKFQDYPRKVDGWVAIARKCITPEEMGPRLYNKLEDKAFEYMDGTTADTFAIPDGVEVLMKALEPKFGEKPLLKIGSAMDGFFNLAAVQKNETLGDFADRLETATHYSKNAPKESSSYRTP